MDRELINKLIIPAAVVAIVGIYAIDAQLTRRSKLKAMKIVAASELAELKIKQPTTDTDTES